MKVIGLGLIHTFWRVCGMRRLGVALKQIYPSAYEDTIFFFNCDNKNNNNDDDDPIQNMNGGLVALTIDDGLVRPRRQAQNNNKKCSERDEDNDDNIDNSNNNNDDLSYYSDDSTSSMVNDICDLLSRYDAHATFFVCTKYTTNHHEEEAMVLLRHGHEFGNHLEEDRSGYYFRLTREEFQNCLRESNQYLNDIIISDHNNLCPNSSSNSNNNNNNNNDGDDDDDDDSSNDKHVKWFRAPQGVMTKQMKEVLKEERMIHVLGDCYCDDWAFAEHYDSNHHNDRRRRSDVDDTRHSRRRTQKMKSVSSLMLKQVQPGSIAIFHMPQHGFREGCYDAIEQFLVGIQQRGMKCVSLTEMMKHYSNEIDC